MAPPEITEYGGSALVSKPVSNDLDSYSIAEFCRRHSISVAMFYKLKQTGEAPETFYVGVRRLISKESARQWRRRREALARTAGRVSRMA